MDSSIRTSVRFLKLSGWPRIIVPLLITSLYCLSFFHFLSWLLPDEAANVNAAFVDNFWKFLLLTALGLYLVFFVFFKKQCTRTFRYENSAKNLSIADGILILLPLTPIVQYVLNNQDILSLSGSLTIVGIFAGFSVVLMLLIPALFSVVGSARILMFIGMAFAFTITNMASLTAHSKWFERGEFRIQFGLFVIVFAAGLILYRYFGKKSTRAVIALYFVVNSVNSLSFITERDDEFIPVAIDNKMVELTGRRTPLKTPDIYFLIYDAYVANETMLGYGIDNSAQEDYLTEAGFQLYPHTYSISASTISTVSRVLNVSASYYGEPRKAVSGDGVVQRLLQNFGYKTRGLFSSDYFFQSGGSHYDHSYPYVKDAQWVFIKAVFMGEFRFKFEFDRPSREEFLKNKVTFFEEIDESPKFVYMHDNLPGHSQNSGKCRPNENKLFENKLKEANEEMKRNIDMILRNHPDALIIVAGDHGPYLTKNCTHLRDEYEISEISRLDLQDRYGTFLAIKWPGGETAENGDIVILQDLFPAVFAFLFDDREFLSARIYPLTGSPAVHTGGVQVKEGLIRGGANDGEALFLSRK